MDSLRDIRLFVAAVEEGSFSGAAARENATQSGVSQHIRNLETRLGVSLFTRATSCVIPTRAGTLYYRRCVQILRQFDEAGRQARAFTGSCAEVRVGLPPWLTRRVLAPAILQFQSAQPNATINIIEAQSAALVEAVKNDELTFAVVPAMPDLRACRRELFARSPELMVAANRPNECSPWDSSARRPLRLVIPSRTHVRRSAVENYCEINGYEIAEFIELDTILGTLDLVASTDWVTILPALILATEADYSRFVSRPLMAPTLSYDLLAISPARRELDPAGLTFLGLLQNQVASSLDAFLDKPTPGLSWRGPGRSTVRDEGTAVDS